METTRKGPGRPSSYTPEIADQICERIASGEPLAQICRSEGMPGVTTVYDWQERHADFSEAIARARLAGFDEIATDALVIADEALPISDEVQRAKLRIETRLKLLAKWDPRRYGDRVTNEHTGPNGGPVQVEEIRRTVVDPTTE